MWMETNQAWAWNSSYLWVFRYILKSLIVSWYFIFIRYVQSPVSDFTRMLATLSSFIVWLGLLDLEIKITSISLLCLCFLTKFCTKQMTYSETLYESRTAAAEQEGGASLNNWLQSFIFNHKKEKKKKAVTVGQHSEPYLCLEFWSSSTNFVEKIKEKNCWCFINTR